MLVAGALLEVVVFAAAGVIVGWLSVPFGGLALKQLVSALFGVGGLVFVAKRRTGVGGWPGHGLDWEDRDAFFGGTPEAGPTRSTGAPEPESPPSAISETSSKPNSVQ